MSRAVHVVTRLKYVARLIMGQSPGSEDCNDIGAGLPFLQGCADFGDKNPVPTIFCEEPPKKAPAGSYLLSVRAPVGRINGADQCYGIGRGLCAIVPSPRCTYPRFIRYLLDVTSEQLRSQAVGSTYEAVSTSDVGNLAIGLPEVTEQLVIADFLDRETAKIDDLVAKKRQLLNLLRSRQEAVVRQFVVGALIAAPKRYSGYSWLGDVPNHWKVSALKRIAKRVVVGIAEASTHAYADTGVPLVRTTDVKANRIDASELLYINKQFADKNQSKYMRAGDIVTARTGNPGISGVVPPELDWSQCFTMLITTLRDGHIPEFFCYYINSEQARTYFALEGWGTAQINISVPILQMLPVPCPPENEQREIAGKIATAVSGSECQVARVQEAIERLQEFRSALISAAVTGQIDVRTHRPREAAALCQ